MNEEDCVNETFSVEVPKKFHDHPKIHEAKKEEMKRWKEYNTVEQFTVNEEIQVLFSQWVVT